jgi:site-specific DNA-cytosine methylase/exonuclease III
LVRKGQIKDRNPYQPTVHTSAIGGSQTASLIPSLTGETFYPVVWNAQGAGRQVCTTQGREALSTWLRDEQPDALIIPEAALPGGVFPRSLTYLEQFQQFARREGYNCYSAHHSSGEARKGATILVARKYQVLEQIYSFEESNGMQQEGRVVGLRFQNFWLLGLYMPHDDGEWDLLTEQATAWINRMDMPVILAADFNAILDEMDQGILVRPSHVQGAVPPNYFSEEWEGKPLFLTQKRRDRTMAWLHQIQMADTMIGQKHTAYGKVAFCLQEKDKALPLHANPGPAYQRRGQVATYRIDTICLNAKASRLFQVQKYCGPPEISAEGTSEHQYQQLRKIALESDHVPVGIKFDTLQPDVFRYTPETEVERCNVLINHKEKKLYMLMALFRLLREAERRLMIWAHRSGQKPTDSVWRAQVTRKNQNLWKRITDRWRSNRMLRYSSLRQIHAHGGVSSLQQSRWDLSYQQCMGHSDFREIKALEPASPVVEMERIAQVVSDLHYDAGVLRNHTTVAAHPRQAKFPATTPEFITPRLWPKMPGKQGKTWDQGGAPNCSAVYCMALLELTRNDTAGRLHRWRLRAHFRSQEPSYSLGALVGREWGSKSYENSIPLNLLMHRCHCAGQQDKGGFMNWSLILPWWTHRQTAGWSEIMMYIHSTLEQITPDWPLEAHRFSIQELTSQQHKRAKLWDDYRSKSLAVMMIDQPSTYKDKYERRSHLQQELNGALAEKGRSRAHWDSNEYHIQDTEAGVVPANLMSPAPSMEPVPADLMSAVLPDIRPATDKPASLVLAGRATRVEGTGLERHTDKEEVYLPKPLDGKNYMQRARQRKKLLKAYADNKPLDEFFADCRKIANTPTGLTYTSGSVRPRGGDDGRPVWCPMQLWDTGSDFNIVSSTLLMGMLGENWMDHLDTSSITTTARMATGAVSKALGTIILEMDWTVAPLKHQLTASGVQDSIKEAHGIWKTICMPIKFIVFQNIELPMILGIPMMAHMTGGIRLPDLEPAYVELYEVPGNVAGTKRKPSETCKLPLRCTRPVPDPLHVCVTDKAQWISSQQNTPVVTRVISGAELLHTATFTEANGWVRTGTPGALEVEIDYYIEGVQYYPTLYSGEKRFTTVGSFGKTVEPLDRQGATLTILVKGEAIGEQQDPQAYQCYSQEGRPGLHPSSTSQDHLAYSQPPKELGPDPVYLPVGTPVAWLEPDVRQTPETQQMLEHLRQTSSCFAHLLEPLQKKQASLEEETEGSVYQIAAGRQEQYLEINKLHRLRNNQYEPRTVAGQILEMKEPFHQILQKLWSIMIHESTDRKYRKWFSTLLHELILNLLIRNRPVTHRQLGLITGSVQARTDHRERDLHVAENMLARLQGFGKRAAQASQIWSWIWETPKQQWLVREASFEDTHSKLILQLLGHPPSDNESIHTLEETVTPETGNMTHTDSPDDDPVVIDQAQSWEHICQLQASIHGQVNPVTEASTVLASRREEASPPESASPMETISGPHLMQESSTHAIATPDTLQEATEYILSVRDQLAQSQPGQDSCDGVVNFISRGPRKSWALTNEEREAIRVAGDLRRELEKELQMDSAFQNPLETILETEIPIPPYMASARHAKLDQEHRDNTGDSLLLGCNEIFGSINEDWQHKIKEACCNSHVAAWADAEQQRKREQRFAGYIASVSLQKFNEHQRNIILNLILELEAFFNCDPKIPPTWVGGEPYADLQLEDENPPVQHQERRIPPLALPVVLETIRGWLSAGIVEPSKSPHNSPLLIVAKKALAPPKDPFTGEPIANYKPKPRYRVCVDYKAVNCRLKSVLISNAPRLETCLHQIASCGGKVFREQRKALEEQRAGKTPTPRMWLATTADLVQGFMQIPIAPECRGVTAFTVPGLHTPEGHLQYKKLPFGLSTVPTWFHAQVGKAIGDLHFGHHEALLDPLPCADSNSSNVRPDKSVQQEACASHYLDDSYCSTYTETFEEHIEAVRATFLRLEKAGFGARVDKVEFCMSELPMLGWTVGEGKLKTDNSKVYNLVSQLGGLDDRLHNAKDVMSVLGAINFYRSAIPNAAGLSAPLYQLTKKGAFTSDADWTRVHTQALRALKRAIVADTFLAAPQENQPFYLISDASVHSGAVVLAQRQPNGAEQPTSYAGTSFPERARRWSASERECYCMLWGAEYYDQWLKMGHAVFCTDHNPLIGLAKAGSRSTNSKLARWAGKLAKWANAIVSYRAGVCIGLADTFSRLIYPAKEETPDNYDSLTVDRQGFEPLENTDTPGGQGRLFGLPMQRLSMLRPPQGQAWVAAEEAFRKATLEEQQSAPALHNKNMIQEVKTETKDQFQKRKDWFESGHLTPELAVRVIELAAQQGQWPGVTAEQLGDGACYVTRWLDTTKLDKYIDNASLSPSSGGCGNSMSSRMKAQGEGIIPEPDSDYEDDELQEAIIVWREIKQQTIPELIQEATGHAPDQEEVEYLCNLGKGQLNFNSRNDPQAYKDRVTSCISGDCIDEDSDYEEDYEEDIEQAVIHDTRYNQRDWGWCNHLQNPDQHSHLEGGDDIGFCNNITEPLSEATPGHLSPTLELWGEWETARQQAEAITKAHCEERDVNGGEIPHTLREYISALCDPRVTTLICQGAAGSGKTYTASLVSTLLLAQGLTHRLYHTKPLVSAGGASVGFEKGSMQDKLKYWTKPAADAVKRIAEMTKMDMTGLNDKVESWPIDRTRGMSLERGTWCLADEMQNAQLPLYTCMMTRPEEGAKVVLVGDVSQSDLTPPKKIGMKIVVDSWEELCRHADGIDAQNKAVNSVVQQQARDRKKALEPSFRYIALDTDCGMRNRASAAMADWAKDMDPRLSKPGRINQISEKSFIKIPAFSGYAGLDNLGHGILQGCPGYEVVGGSETDYTAAEVFRRRYRFLPFEDQLKVAPHVLGGIYVATSGTPCPSFTLRGSQKGATHAEGLMYEKQAQQYADAQIPIIVLEQVPGCRQILAKDTYSTKLGTSPHTRAVQHLQEGGYHVITGDDLQPGQLMRSTDLGGAVDRIRLITIAVRNDVWEICGKTFQWPVYEGPATRASDHLSPHPLPEYIGKGPNVELFNPVDFPSRCDKPDLKWIKKGCPIDSLGSWDNPDKIYSPSKPIPACSALGNTRWVEWVNPDSESIGRRRIAPLEEASMFGIDKSLLTGLGSGEQYRLIGNAVPVAIGAQIGRCIRQLIVPAILTQRRSQWLQQYEQEAPKTGRDCDDREVHTYAMRNQMLERIRITQEQGSILPPAVGDATQALKDHELVEASMEDQDIQAVLYLLDCGSHTAGLLNCVSDTVEGDASENHALQERVMNLADRHLQGNTQDRREAYARLQQDDEWCQRLRLFLLQGILPADDELAEARTCQEAARYTMMDGLLYRHADADKSAGIGLQLCTPAVIRTKLISMCHRAPTAMHPQAEQMAKLISRRHYWPRIAEDCRDMVKQCSVCQRAERAPKEGNCHKHHVPIGKPLSVVAIDVVGPIGNSGMTTARGNRYLVTMVDWFTRYVCIYPVREPTAEAIGNCMESFIGRFGVPLTVISDNASYFKERSLREIEERLGLRRAWIAAHRPQGNGLLERFHRTLGRALKCHVHDSRSVNWDVGLDLMTLGYNSMEHHATGYSPHYLMHGYHPALPFDVIEPIQEETYATQSAWVQETQQRLNRAHSLAFERMQDLSHARILRSRVPSQEQHQLGDMVYMYIPAVPRGFARKCTLRWHGPFEVVSGLSGRSYGIRTHNGKIRLVHESRLKKVTGHLNFKVEDNQIQKEFEELLDQGTRAPHDDAWGNLTRILAQSNLDGVPMETIPPYRNDYVYVFDKGDLPYSTIRQQQTESREPRLDVTGEEPTVETRVNDAIHEATQEVQEITVRECTSCKRIHGASKQHCSICTRCSELLQMAPNADSLDSRFQPNRWYREAQDRGSEQPAPSSHHRCKIQGCATCDTLVYVPLDELRQHCRQRPVCQGAAVVPSSRWIMTGWQYIRCTEIPIAGQSENARCIEWAPTQNPDIPEDSEAIPEEEIEALERSGETTSEHSLERICGFMFKKATVAKAYRSAYKVQWPAPHQDTWESPTSLYSCADLVVQYWRSKGGTNRLHQLHQVEEHGPSDSWKYNDWAARMTHGNRIDRKQIKYIAAIELTKAGHPTHSAWAKRLQNTASFNLQAEFTVWVLPKKFKVGPLLLPLQQVTYQALRYWVSDAQWAPLQKSLVDHFRGLAINAPVPIFYPYSEQEDHKMGLKRLNTSYERSMESVLN